MNQLNQYKPVSSFSRDPSVDNVNWIPTFSIFAEFEILQVFPKDFRPNYYPRDTIATRLLSSGLSLDEVAHQLGHTPGSPMTRRYAKYLASAQQNIADRSQSVMDEMLGQPKSE